MMNENPFPARPDHFVDPADAERADAERPRESRCRRRQYDLDRITFQYVQDYRAGRPANLRTYIQRYPEFARELRNFALYFHSIGDTLPEPDPVPVSELSEAARAALARIHAEAHTGEQSLRAEDAEQATSTWEAPRDGMRSTSAALHTTAPADDGADEAFRATPSQLDRPEEA